MRVDDRVSDTFREITARRGIASYLCVPLICLGDIIGCIGVCWECKGGHAAEQASDGQVAAWLLGETETERVNAGADVGILVTKRKAIGARFAGLWWAHMTIGTVVELVMGRGKSNRLPTWLSDAPIRMHLADAVMMLRRAGYGTEVGA